MQVLAVPAAGFHILLPVNMIAQIIGTMPVSESEIEFPSLAGNITWREYKVPLLRSTELMAHLSGADDKYQRIVILWPVKSTGNDAFLAFTSLGSPKVIDITDQQAREQESNMAYTLGSVQLEDSIGVIPDIESLCNDLFKQG